MNNIIMTLILVMIIGCGARKSRLIQHHHTRPHRNDTTPARERLIPLARSGDTIPAYKAMRQVERDLGLDNLIYGYDSIQIRMFLVYSLHPERQMVILSKSGGIWQATVLDIEIKFDTDTTALYTISGQKTVNPKSGWPDFIDGIFGLGIRDIPDYRSLPGYSFQTDEPLVVIEYATAEMYKIISYPSRPGETNLLPQEIQIEKMIQYLEKELGLTRYNAQKSKSYE